MKKLLQFCLSVIAIPAFAQTGLTENFNDNALSAAWKGNASYALTEANGELNVNANVANASYSAFAFTFSALDLTANPFVKLKIKSNLKVEVRIDFIDNTGKESNALPVIRTVNNALYTEFEYTYNGRFSQSWPSSAVVNASAITGVRIYFNPGTAFTGAVQIEDLQIGSNTGMQLINDKIRLNQIGFYPQGPKTAVIVGSAGGNFYVVSENKQTTLYTGTLGAEATWTPSGEAVRKADFSGFKTPGKYYLQVPGVGYSHVFEIKNSVHKNVANALTKALYFQRSSTALTAPYAGAWARAAGHPDDKVIIHNSAASPGRPTGSTINSSKGWYDAGDYNKYVVNSGISTYTLLRLYEEFPDYISSLNLNIPESSNQIPDVLDEALWNVRWLLTMQDPYDGGVYHKVTNTDFDKTIMPAAATAQRYVVQKSTGAALNFAAVMAQSARIFSIYPTQLPGMADSCISAAFKAWNWARQNPNIIYEQTLLKDPVITTGTYKDTNFSDEFQWAGFELYATTKLDSFYTIAGTISFITVPGWNNVSALGYSTLAHYRKSLTAVCDTQAIKNKVTNLATGLRNEALNNSAFGVSMTNGYFNWGSSGTAANHGMMALIGFNINKDSSYYKTAIAQLDYLFGRNGTNYCFVTGFGTVSPQNIHHRISTADGVEAPVPGLLAGGPNIDSQSDCGANLYPSNTLKGKAYLDAECSYSTNEVTINWNAPAAFLANSIEALNNNVSARALSFTPVLPKTVTSINESREKTLFNLYPNPAENEITVEANNLINNEIQIADYTGRIILKMKNIDTFNRIDVTELPSGLYFVILSGVRGVTTKKFIK